MQVRMTTNIGTSDTAWPGPWKDGEVHECDPEVGAKLIALNMAVEVAKTEPAHAEPTPPVHGEAAHPAHPAHGEPPVVTHAPHAPAHEPEPKKTDPSKGGKK